MRRLVQFVRDLALIPAMWRRSVDHARRELASTQLDQARVNLDKAVHELQSSDGPRDDLDWTRKFIGHRIAQVHFDIASADLAASFERSKVFSRPRERSPQKPSGSPIAPVSRPKQDDRHPSEPVLHDPETDPSSETQFQGGLHERVEDHAQCCLQRVAAGVQIFDFA